MEKIYTPEEIAEHLHVQERTVYGWLRSGKLKGAKLGRLWRIRVRDYEAFLEASTVTTRNHGEDTEEGDNSNDSSERDASFHTQGPTKQNATIGQTQSKKEMTGRSTASSDQQKKLARGTRRRE